MFLAVSSARRMIYAIQVSCTAKLRALHTPWWSGMQRRPCRQRRAAPAFSLWQSEWTAGAGPLSAWHQHREKDVCDLQKSSRNSIIILGEGRQLTSETGEKTEA